MTLDLIIVGAGPAGVTSAIYAKRSNLNFKLFEKEAIGGNVTHAYEVENYTGVRKILGGDLAFTFYEQLNDLGIDVEYSAIENIIKVDDIFKVRASNGETYEAKNVILALGTNPRKLNLPNENNLLGRGVSFCATCDGAFNRGKDVLVMGGGNSAITESLYLSKIVNKLYLATRHELKGDPKEIEQIKSLPNVEVLEFKQIKELVGEDHLDKVILKDTNTDETSEVKVSSVFVYIGQVPPTKFLENLNILNSRGFIETDNHFETKVKGLFAIGDCIDKEVRQIATAVGDAATVMHYLKK